MFLYLCTNFGLVAQWIEQQPSKLRVIGSNPIGVTLSYLTVCNPMYCKQFFIYTHNITHISAYQHPSPFVSIFPEINQG